MNSTSFSAIKIFWFLSNLKFDAVIMFFSLTAFELPLVKIISLFFWYVASSE